ncbi:cytochrome P450 [Rhodococcus koreensis]
MTMSEAVRGCPVHTFNPYENSPVGTKLARYDQLREEAPIIRNSIAQGYYVVTRHEDILATFQDPETFSSRAVEVFTPEPDYRWIPETLDGDEHFQWRRQLGPEFSPKSVARLDDTVRRRAIELIDAIADRGSCEFMADFAFQYPTSIFLELMGLPIEHLDHFMEWEHDILHGSGSAEEVVARQTAAMGAVNEYFAGVIAERRQNPGGEDLISKALEFQIDGAPVNDEDMGSFCLLMFMAGLDTVSATLGLSFYHLAQHPEDRSRIVENPELIPTAIEEFIRVYAIVVPSRKATRDTEIAGCPVKAGEMIALPLNSASRDDAAFEDATTFKIDRSPNNHIGFGAGPHRCLGSHLARRELKIALEEWHKRIPHYRLGEGVAPHEPGNMLGIDAVSLVWEPAQGATRP